MTVEQVKILGHVVWILLLAGTLLFEGYTLGKGVGSLTSNVGILTAIWIGRAVVGGTLVWLFWHWILDRKPGIDWKDGLAALVGAVIAVLAGRHRDKR